jgi:hypothetical protein
MTISLLVGFLFVSFLAMWLTGILFCLAIGDLMQVHRERLNGAIQFMSWDNVRHQGFVFILAVVLFCCAMWIASLDPVSEDYRVRERVGMIVRIVVAGGVVIDALFTFHRRRTMAVLVGEYMGQRGGRRKTDPPAVSVQDVSGQNHFRQDS